MSEVPLCTPQSERDPLTSALILLVKIPSQDKTEPRDEASPNEIQKSGFS